MENRLKRFIFGNLNLVRLIRPVSLQGNPVYKLIGPSIERYILKLLILKYNVEWCVNILSVSTSLKGLCDFLCGVIARL